MKGWYSVDGRATWQEADDLQVVLDAAAGTGTTIYVRPCVVDQPIYLDGRGVVVGPEWPLRSDPNPMPRFRLWRWLRSWGQP